MRLQYGCNLGVPPASSKRILTCLINMNQSDIQILKIAVGGLYNSVQSRDTLNLATMKLLARRLSFLEMAFQSSLGETSKAFTEGQEEVAQEFNDRIAKIESHQEKLESYFSTLNELLGMTDADAP